MEEEYPGRVEDSKTKKKSGLVSTILLLLAGGIGVFLGVHFWEGHKAWKDYEERIKRNMNPHSVYFEGNIFGNVDYVDVNNDGRYESILKFENPITGERESRLIEHYSGNIILRKFSSKRKKQIKYEHPFKQETSPPPVR